MEQELFNINNEIDKIVDKQAEELRVRLKRVVARSERMVLKHYISSQKNSNKNKKEVTVSSSRKAGKSSLKKSSSYK